MTLVVASGGSCKLCSKETEGSSCYNEPTLGRACDLHANTGWVEATIRLNLPSRCKEGIQFVEQICWHRRRISTCSAHLRAHASQCGGHCIAQLTHMHAQAPTTAPHTLPALTTCAPCAAAARVSERARARARARTRARARASQRERDREKEVTWGPSALF